MEKNSLITIKCYFVSTIESKKYISDNKLSGSLSLLDCSAKVVNRVNDGDVYTYFNGYSIIDKLKNAFNDGSLSIIGTVDDISKEGYNEYRFRCGDTIYDIVVPEQRWENVDLHFVDARDAFNKLVRPMIRQRNIGRLKKISAAVVTLGMLGAGASFVKSNLNDEDVPTYSDAYHNYYEGIMSEEEFNELTYNLRESYVKVKDK